MGEFSSLEDQANTFADAFPDEGRAAVREWYLGQLRQDERRSSRNRIEAGVSVLMLAGVVPGLALFAYWHFS